MEIRNINGVFVAFNHSGKEVARSKSKYYLKQKIQGYEEAPEVDNKSIEFSINQRFQFVEQIVSMIARRVTPSVVITGEGGLGKTHTVINSLKSVGLKDITEIVADADAGTTIQRKKNFVVIKGFSTAKGLFKLLYENKDSIVVFDDTDSILRDADAINLLKGALDSCGNRYITWNTSLTDDGLPRSFKFTGGIIFISNMKAEKIDQAIRSRSMCIDLSMTTDQKIERMETIMQSNEFLPEISLKSKQDALEAIKEFKEIAREISLRTLIMVSRIRNTGGADWKQLSKYMLVN